MRRQVEYLTLENERLQSQLKEALASADSPGAGNWNDDEDGDDANAPAAAMIDSFSRRIIIKRLPLDKTVLVLILVCGRRIDK